MSNTKAHYAAALEWLFAQLPFYQNQGAKAFKPGLDNIQHFCAHLGNPHTAFRSIHVAGTNGKGSTAHMLAAVLQEAGYRVGLYTSPHLKDFRERIKINGRAISEAAVIDFIARNQQYLEAQQCSFFEVTVGMAFHYFAQQKVDIAIVEVGMGGRLDATNIITPEISVITNIGLDHTAFLGTTRAAIAGEKAGIIKAGVPVVLGENDPETAPVFIAKAKAVQAPYYFKDLQPLDPTLTTDLMGRYQHENALLVQAVVQLFKDFKISPQALQLGLQRVVHHTQLQGRWQTVAHTPKVILDVSHNAAGFAQLEAQLKGEHYTQLHLVLGFVKDKDLSALLQYLPKTAQFYLTQPQVVRALAVTDLAKTFTAAGFQYSTYDTPKAALQAAKTAADPTDVILVTGSNFIVADVL